ncbi:hypothetical protein BDM02DRAFT_3119989 [Thelephora ganbajun]|uniref:Uncharacterized protein n=1 Tax=Thelephora ganbajun TaxID=370292 RepID=A0ACB6Z875_THEGA|nr:hypothetical protein BDM02DRAFT_3119989 [Thelephora ganbajun]
MGSKTSKAKRPTSAETETIIIPVGPRIPQDIIDEILGCLALSSGFELTKSLETPLRSCSLVSKSWVPSCRRYLFYTIRFTARDMAKWLETFPVPKEDPAHYVRKLRLSFGGCHDVPREFFKHTQWFVNVERMVLEGYEFNHPFKMPLFTRLPQSVTSLEIFALRIDLVRVWDVMAQLPNLDDLRLRGDVVEDGKLWPGLGTALKAKFGGKLELYGEHTDEGVVDILLEVPTGLHFTETTTRLSSGPSTFPSTKAFEK